MSVGQTTAASLSQFLPNYMDFTGRLKSTGLPMILLFFYEFKGGSNPVWLRQTARAAAAAAPLGAAHRRRLFAGS